MPGYSGFDAKNVHANGNESLNKMESITEQTDSCGKIKKRFCTQTHTHSFICVSSSSELFWCRATSCCLILLHAEKVITSFLHMHSTKPLFYHIPNQ